MTVCIVGMCFICFLLVLTHSAQLTHSLTHVLTQLNPGASVCAWRRLRGGRCSTPPPPMQTRPSTTASCTRTWICCRSDHGDAECVLGHTHTETHTHRHTHRDTYTQTHTHRYTHTNIYIYIYTHAHAHTCAQTHTHQTRFSNRATYPSALPVSPAVRSIDLHSSFIVHKLPVSQRVLKMVEGGLHQLTDGISRDGLTRPGEQWRGLGVGVGMGLHMQDVTSHVCLLTDHLSTAVSVTHRRAAKPDLKLVALFWIASWCGLP